MTNAKHVALTALLLLLVGCKEKAPAVQAEPDSKQPAQDQKALDLLRQPVINPCTPEVTGGLAGTLKDLRAFDAARVEAFTPNVTVPSPPAFDSGENSYSKEKKQAEYQQKLAQAEKELATYLKPFFRDWNRTEMTAIKKTKLGLAHPTGTMAFCHVRDVSGACKRVCMQVANAAGQLKVTDSRVCEMGADMAYWRDSCDLTFNCAVDHDLSIDKPGISYKADHYQVSVKAMFTPAQKALTEAVDTLASQVGPGDLVMLLNMRSWEFKDDTWQGLSVPDSDANVPKLSQKNDACHKLVKDLTDKQKR